MIMISENFSLAFQEKKRAFLTETVIRKVLKLSSILRRYSDISHNAFKPTIIPCCQSLYILSGFFNIYSCSLDSSCSNGI